MTDSNPASGLTITKYKTDEDGNYLYDEDGSLIEVEYNVAFNTLGDESGTASYYLWNSAGSTLSTSGASSTNSDIVVYDESSRLIYSSSSYALGVIDTNFVKLGGSSSNGGAISNMISSASVNMVMEGITGNFIDNTGLYGGAIFNYIDKSNSNITIKYIEGDFVSNAGVYGVFSNYLIGTNNSTVEIGNVTGTFLENTASLGGVFYNIVNSGGEIIIGDITGDFIGNSVSNSASGQGGAIYNNVNQDITYTKSVYDNGSISIGNITGSFIDNYATTRGGAICNEISDKNSQEYTMSIDIDSINADFIGNSSNLGGAIYNKIEGGTLTIKNGITGDFISNYVTTKGGAIYSYASNGTIDLGNVEGNFVGNYAISTSYVQGGAIYLYNTGITLTANSSNIYNYGNWAGTSEANASDANGGFLYLDSSTANFNIGDTYSMTIGDGTANHDSIAGTGSITKSGLGELIVNSSMASYSGSLTVSAGEMTINNILGASSVEISSGATLTMGISTNNVFSNSSLSLTNYGTLSLVASVGLDDGAEFAVFANSSSYSSSSTGSITTFGGTYNDNVFKVSVAKNLVLNVGAEVTVSAGDRVAITASSDEDATTSVYLAFSSDSNGATINSVTENEAFVSAYNDAGALAVGAYDFDIDLNSAESVLLSLYVGNDSFDVSQFTIYHLGSDDIEWGEATVSDVSYDGEYVSFVVDGFSSYGYVVSNTVITDVVVPSSSVPEPSTYAMIFGVLALGFAAYRRRK